MNHKYCPDWIDFDHCSMKSFQTWPCLYAHANKTLLQVWMKIRWTFFSRWHSQRSNLLLINQPTAGIASMFDFSLSACCYTSIMACLSMLMCLSKFGGFLLHKIYASLLRLFRPITITKAVFICFWPLKQQHRRSSRQTIPGDLNSLCSLSLPELRLLCLH